MKSLALSFAVFESLAHAIKWLGKNRISVVKLPSHALYNSSPFLLSSNTHPLPQKAKQRAIGASHRDGTVNIEGENATSIFSLLAVSNHVIVFVLKVYHETMVVGFVLDIRRHCISAFISKLSNFDNAQTLNTVAEAYAVAGKLLLEGAAGVADNPDEIDILERSLVRLFE